MRMSTVNSIEPKMETETEMNSKCPIGSLFKYFPLLVLSTDLRTQSSDFQRPQESTQFLKFNRTSLVQPGEIQSARTNERPYLNCMAKF